MKSRIVYQVRRGQIVAKVRQLRRKKATHHTISVYRLNRTEDAWTKSVIFGPEDIPVVQFVLGEAHDWLIANNRAVTRGGVS